MELDLSKLSGLSDNELKNKIIKAATLMGADRQKVESALSDTSKIRSAIGSLSQKDIDALINTIGKDKAKDISRIIDSEK